MAWNHASKIIEMLRKQLGLDSELFTIEKIWDKEVGIDGIKIVGYKNGTIFTRTESSVACCELIIRKDGIIKRLNQYIGNIKIKNIKVKIG
ncbi:MAG: DciA family protein [Endomicrobium sp.]|jgi:hypothetical protein|nr:DciA family protein [Endomicrobium sp.]